MNKYAKLIAGLAMIASVSAHAAVITVSGKSFDDRGTSVIDKTSGLEWMDFSATFARSTCSVLKDTGSAVPVGCSSFDNVDLIANSDGWRAATRAETAQLLSNWFNVSVGLTSSGTFNPALSAQFLSVFANGASSINPNFFPDHPNPQQAVGFYLQNGHYNMNFFNGSINGLTNSTALVRDAAIDVPEPGSLALLGLTLPALLMARRRRN